jgi:hypothetical protein
MISHLNQLNDIEKAKRIGIEKYHKEQLAKIEILNEFLQNYDNGHRDVFFCLAVNLMEIDDLRQVLVHLDDSTKGFNSSEKSDFAKQLLVGSAKKKNITLKLRKGSW